MCLSLYDYQAKTSRYRKELMYLKKRATTNQNKKIHSQKLKTKGHKHKIKGNHQTKGEKKGKTWNQLENKVKNGNKYIVSIITLNVIGLNSPIKQHRVVDWIKKPRAYNMLPTKDSP